MQRNSITLFQYAGFLLVVGLASAFYSAADRTAGWNPHGATGLYACGGSALIIALMAWLTGKGKEWAAWVGLVLAFVLLAYGGQTLFKLVRDVPGQAILAVSARDEKIAEQIRAADEISGGRRKEGHGVIIYDYLDYEAAHRVVLYKAGIFGMMAIFSLSAFLRLGLALRHGKTA